MTHQNIAERRAQLRLEEYFAGKTRAYGVFQDRFGTLRRQLTVDLDGAWDGATLTLDEDFVYDDGSTEERTWYIEKTGEDSYRGRCADVLGTADGKAHGNELHWSYDFSLRVGDRNWNVRFDDRFFLQHDNVLINRAIVSKFGVRIGDLTMIFQKSEAPAS